MANSTVITTLNCEGVVRSTDYIKSFIDETSCDILCLQELWLHENDLVKLGNINSNYMYTGVFGMSSSQILRGRPYGGTAILFKKSLAQYVTRINCKNKRVSGVKICMNNNFTCLLLSVYMPCDNHSNVVNQQYVEVIDCIENIFNSVDFNAFIVYGDYNTSFSRANAQTACLSEFITRNNLHNSWTHHNSVADFTYTNFSLNHMSCILIILL